MESDPKEKKKILTSIPTSKFARGMRIARLTASVGAQAFSSKVSTLFSDAQEKAEKGLLSQIKQAQKIADALSQMKGAAMKLGQILSIHGEHLFPKEVTEILSTLQQHSDEMVFSEIEKIVKAELHEKYGRVLVELSSTPIASASIGQVHQATYLQGDQKTTVAVKVQYPGVDQSIDSDVDSLASILSVLTKTASLEGFNTVTDEIKSILRQETDYLEEGRSLEAFRKFFQNDSSLVIPEYFSEVSTRKILSTELVKGISVQEFAASTASPQARRLLGEKFFEVFYHELFDLGKVQTDPNFANYKIQWSFGVQDPKLVLLDFGAVKSFDKEFRENYRQMVRACLEDDYNGIRDSATRMGFLKEDEPKELIDLHYEMVKMFMEPFQSGKLFKWSENDLAERIRKFTPKFVFAFKLRPPPKDLIFLNRKIAGLYFFCSAIKAEFDPRPIVERFMTEHT